MALIAVAIRLLRGKTEAWRKWVEELNAGGAGSSASRANAPTGASERSSSRPRWADLVIVTVEGDDSARAFRPMMGATEAFSTWFAEKAREFRGHVPAPTEAPSQLVIDTRTMAGQAT